MGWLRKKGKQIVKGIKSAFKKVKGVFGKVFSKLGVLGQIGMMFLMPYAAGAIGSFFGGAGKLASWSSKLLSKSGIGAKALGHTLNLVNKAGTFAGNVYNTVSNTISGAIDRTGNFLKGRGFVKTPVLDPNIVQQGIDVSQTTLGEGTASVIGKDGKVMFDTGFDETGLNVKALSQVPKETTNLLDLAEKDFAKALTTDTKALTQALTDSGVPSIESLLKPKEDTFLQKINIFDKESAIRKDIAEIDFYETGKQYAKDTLEESIVGGAKAGLTQKAAEAFGYETPEGPSSYYIDIPEMMDAGAMNPSVYNQVDLTAQRQGNNYFTSNIQNSNYLNNLIGEGSDAYNAYMSNFAASQYTPMQRALGMGV